MSKRFFEDLQYKYGISLTKQQKQAVLHNEGPCLTIAVPGAGKTTVLISRTAYLLMYCGVLPENILSVTFSKSSAKDMDLRFSTIFRHLSSNIHFSTIHSFAYQIVREYSYLTKMQYTMIEGVNAPVTKSQILKQLYLKYNGQYINEDKLDELSNTIGYIKNMLLTGNEIKDAGIEIPNFYEIYTKYEEIKKANHNIDYDDMLTMAFDILKMNSYLLNKYRKRFTYIQVDEAQDSSKVQFEIVKLLAKPKNNMFIVCDDDQSIYSFRGADPKGLLSFKDEYPDTKVFLMEENFRSTKAIVRAANEFIKGNETRFKKDINTSNSEGEQLNIQNLNSEYDQLDNLVKTFKTSETLSDHAVLYRNNISAIALADTLERQGIGFYIREQKQYFFKHWVVRDIVSFISLMIDRSNLEAFESIYYKMNSFLPKAAIEFMKENGVAKSVFLTLLVYPGITPLQVKRLMKLEEMFKCGSLMSPESAISFIEVQLSYGDYLRKDAEKLGYSIDNLRIVLSSIKQIAKNAKSNVDFLTRLEFLEEAMDKSKFNRSKNAVVLSTIHSAKGLEWKKVWMIDLIDKQFPSINSVNAFQKGDKSLLEEERRLFYVGMTRAKEQLNLYVINTKNGESTAPSMFVKDVLRIIKKENAADSESQYLQNPSGGIIHIETGEILSEDTTIEHKLFGEGKVVKIEKDYATIDFKKVGVKVLSLELCIRKKLIKIV